MLDPLYTAAEMRAAEARYPGFPDTAPDLMDRAGRAVAALRIVFTFDALALFLHALLALMAILALLAILTLGTRIGSFFSGFASHWRYRRIGRRGSDSFDRCIRFFGRTGRTARAIGPLLEAASRTPDFDESRLLSGGRTGRGLVWSHPTMFRCALCSGKSNMFF